MPDSASPRSPRLRKVVDAIAAGEAGAEAGFWHEMRSMGTPLIERIDGQPNACLVTFVWEGDESTRNVVLVEWYSPGQPRDKQLTRLPGSDIWYRTLVFRSDILGVYRFSVNDSLLPIREDPDAEVRFARMQLDPLNPRRVLPERLWESAQPEWGDASVLVLPDAPEQPREVESSGVPHCPVVEAMVPSAILGQERRIWVHTREGADARDEADLLIQFDGDRCLDVFDLPWLLDELLARNELPPLVTVMVDTPDRGVDLPCNEGFASFVADELIPWARDRYPIGEGPERIVVAGQSYGGLAAAWVGLRHPDVVGKVLSQSGSFWWAPEYDQLPSELPLGVAPIYAWLPSQIASWPPSAVRFHLEAGTLEAGNEGVEPSLLATNRHMRDVLVARGHEVSYREYPGGHDYAIWRGTYPDALKSLLRR